VCCVLRHEYTVAATSDTDHTERFLTTNLLDNVGTEFLDGEGAYIPCELTNHSVAKPVVVQVKDVLDHLAR
jgi:hypothetical protein